MDIRTALAAALLAAPAAAQTDAQRSAVSALWQEAMQEQRVLLTCGAPLGEASDALIRDAWERERLVALATMAEADWPQTELDALAAASASDALRLPDATPFGAVLALCAASPDWTRKAMTLRFMPLAEQVAVALSR